jgi:hypothetical protein
MPRVSESDPQVSRNVSSFICVCESTRSEMARRAHRQAAVTTRRNHSPILGLSSVIGSVTFFFADGRAAFEWTPAGFGLIFSVILFPICRLLIKENECFIVDVVRRYLFARHTEIIKKFCFSLQSRAKVFL